MAGQRAVAVLFRREDTSSTSVRRLCAPESYDGQSHHDPHMLLKIVQVGDPVLREAARILTAEEIKSREIQKLIEDMRETMHKAPGVGLAAPQVGRSLQLAVIEDKPEYMKDVEKSFLRERERQPVPFHVVINPRIISADSKAVDFFEGCLSLAGFTAIVPRARKVRVDCLDAKGKPKVIEASGWYARILQHEIDHLQGGIYIDRMLPRSFMGVENYKEHWKEKRTAEVMELLGGKF
jgi:peptide deformylase